jgi:diguanylate cyclase (GGDEF)-like protein
MKPLKRHSMSIKTRLLALLALPLIAVTLVLVVYNTHSAIERETINLHRYAEKVTLSMAELAQLPLFAGDRAGLNTVAASMMRASDISSIWFFDEQRKLISLHPLDRHNSDRQSVLPTLSFDDASRYLDREYIDGQYLYRTVAVYQSTEYFFESLEHADSNAEPELLGWIAIAIELNEYQAYQRKVFQDNILIGLLVLSITLWLVRRFSLAIVNSILGITVAVGRYSQGDFNHRVEEVSDGELGDLETGINRLAQLVGKSQLSLQETNRKLSSYNDELNLRVKEKTAHLEEANRELEVLSEVDSLTRLKNRRCFDKRLQQEWQRLGRSAQPLSLLMCDIDFFKEYNDTYGHLVGDDCLVSVAQEIAQVCKRGSDVVSRYGGEEFAIILPQATTDEAVAVAIEVIEAINKLSIQHDASPIRNTVSLSIGLVTMIPMVGKEPNTLVRLADEALYQSKHEGRNRYTVFTEGVTSDA